MNKNYKKFTKQQRKNHARKWLITNRRSQDLITWYSKKYKVDKAEAEHELYKIGYMDQVKIEKYELSGEEWEYKVDG